MKKMLRIVKYDFKMGVGRNRYKYLLCSIVFFILCADYYKVCIHLKDMTVTPNAIDFLLYIFKGVDVYKPTLYTIFEIPINWLVIHLLIAFLISSYPVSELYSNGFQMMLRTKSLSKYWISKCIWVASSVIIFYLLFYLMIVIFTLKSGGQITMTPTNSLLQAIFGNDTVCIKTFDLFVGIIVLPIVTSIVISLIQMLVSYMAAPVYGYLSVVIIVVFSVYYYKPYLMGNNFMFCRSQYFIEGGYDVYRSLINAAVLFVIIIVIGRFYFNRISFIHKNKEGD